MNKIKCLIGFLRFIVRTVTAQEGLLNQYVVTSDREFPATNTFILKGEGPFLVILIRTPYDKDLRKYEVLFNSKGYVFEIG